MDLGMDATAGSWWQRAAATAAAALLGTWLLSNLLARWAPRLLRRVRFGAGAGTVGTAAGAAHGGVLQQLRQRQREREEARAEGQGTEEDGGSGAMSAGERTLAGNEVRQSLAPSPGTSTWVPETAPIKSAKELLE